MWAGQLNYRVGDHLAGVGYADEAVAIALRRACSHLEETGERADVPVSLGVRSVSVGLRRRRLWLVHHGTPVRHRSADLPGAAAFVSELLTALGHQLAEDEAELPLRAFVKSERAVLVDVPLGADVDERPLNKRGIVQLPSLGSVVAPASREVRSGNRRFSVVGVVVGAPADGAVRDLDDRRRALVSRANRHQLAWAWQLDELGEHLVDAEDLTSAIRSLLD